MEKEFGRSSKRKFGGLGFASKGPDHRPFRAWPFSNHKQCRSRLLLTDNHGMVRFHKASLMGWGLYKRTDERNSFVSSIYCKTVRRNEVVWVMCSE